MKYGAKPDSAQPQPNFIDIEITIRVPTTQEVIYTPPFWSVIKFAWVQYFCTLVFWYYVLYIAFWGGLVRTKVFNSVVVSDFSEKRLAMRD